jgi:hypothetical protein
MINTDITLVSFANPRWDNEEQTLINGDLQWSVMDEVQNGSVLLTENYSHVQTLRVLLESGEFGPIAPYVAPVKE